MLERLFEEPASIAIQRTLDDLGTPLHDVTFVVLDLETTGGSPATCAITEVGAVRIRGGQNLGTFQTMVDPGRAIPPEITVLTGITQSMVMRAPTISTVLPSLLEFIGDAVVVGHNIRFDRSFLDAALVANQRPRLTNRFVDTVGLGRRLVQAEVRNLKLGTLAQHFNFANQPSHRALDDALATADLLHLLIERAAAAGVTGLDDLLALPKMDGHKHAAKLALTTGLPRSPGVYVFRSRQGTVLYVGKASNLRSRVRSYFSTDPRRKVTQLLRETARIEHKVCRNSLEAAVLEIRLIHRHLPRFNQQGTRTRKYVYVKLTLNERFPRLSVVREARNDDAIYLGPLSSRRTAALVVDAIESVSALRRCNRKGRANPNLSPCAAAQLGVTACPCSGATSPSEYQRIVDEVVAGLTARPWLLLNPLESRMTELATAERYEEAADVRDRAHALASALKRQRRFDLWRRAGTVQLSIGPTWATVERGRLVAMGHIDEPPALLDPELALPAAEAELAASQVSLFRSGLPVPTTSEADELLCIAAWLEKQAHNVQLVACGGELAEPIPILPTYNPRPSR